VSAPLEQVLKKGPPMHGNTERVLAFFAAWERRDLDAIVAAMSDNVLYENFGFSASRGHDEVRAFLSPFVAAASAIRFNVHHIAETSDGVVLTERTDEFVRSGTTVAIPVAGRFQFDRSGRISHWRDYIDVATSVRDLAATAPK
jgi:limonene-1,2-epoxide hydrolase